MLKARKEARHHKTIALSTAADHKKDITAMQKLEEVS
jgi:hypothetical protein